MGGYQAYSQPYNARRQSIQSNPSRHSSSPRAGTDFDDEREKGRCPNPDCGRIFKDLEAHALTHQPERPEKCPILNCEYNQKGFARKYDKNRHTLTHYKGQLVCGFCPGSGSGTEKSFNRADLFKRHLTSVHGAEQSPLNAQKKSPTAGSQGKLTSYSHDATGKCPTCLSTFKNVQGFYKHLGECVLLAVQQEEPREAINQQRLTEIAKDPAGKDTMERHMLSTDTTKNQVDGDEEDKEGDYKRDPTYNERSGKGRTKSNESNSSSRAILDTSSAITKTFCTTNGGPRYGLTYFRGSVPLIGKGCKETKQYPSSWDCSVEKMKMKKRVLSVYDGSRRLWKDDMMLYNEFEARMKLPDGKSGVTHLDVETLKRAQGLHGATDEEKGLWDMQEVDINELMRK
jgi:hypothetical protein